MKGVRFGDIHSYDDLGLVLGKFTLSPATPQLNFLKIPGRDGYLDLTEANGGVKYNSREFIFTFTVAPEFVQNFDERIYLVTQALHGKRLPIVLDRDEKKQWIGRCVVDKCERDKNIQKITVKAIVDPYARIRRTVGVAVSRYFDKENLPLKNKTSRNINSVEVTYIAYGDEVPATISFDGKEYQIESGTTVVLDVCLVPGDNIFVVTLYGYISIAWWEEVL